MPKIFISYRRSDSEDVTGRIYDRLVEHFGEEEVFFDVNVIPPGVDFPSYLHEALKQCQVMLAVIGPGWLNATDAAGNRRLEDPKDWVCQEIERGLMQQDMLVVPLLVSHAELPKIDELPPALKPLAYRNQHLVRPGRDFHKDIDWLIEDLEKYLTRLYQQPQSGAGQQRQYQEESETITPPRQRVETSQFQQSQQEVETPNANDAAERHWQSQAAPAPARVSRRRVLQIAGLSSGGLALALAANALLGENSPTGSRNPPPEPTPAPPREPALSSSAPPAPPDPASQDKVLERYPDLIAGLPFLEGTAIVEMLVNGAKIVMELDGEKAPVTTGNFVDLVNRGVYNGLMFHRVVREPQPFVVQAGDPRSRDPQVPVGQLGTGGYIDPQTGQPRLIPLEIDPQNRDKPLYNQTFEVAGIVDPPKLTHTRGAVAMARSQAVESASSQFYIALTDLPFLDGYYAVFGYVIEGMEAVDQIRQGDRIESARVVRGLDDLEIA